MVKKNESVLSFIKKGTFSMTIQISSLARESMDFTMTSKRTPEVPLIKHIIVSTSACESSSKQENVDVYT
eukprot:c34879_g1_i1 orf=50-259(+)